MKCGVLEAVYEFALNRAHSYSWLLMAAQWLGGDLPLAQTHHKLFLILQILSALSISSHLMSGGPIFISQPRHLACYLMKSSISRPGRSPLTD